MADHPRIEQLRRRVQQDPASIAFAQLAEEHRRVGQHEEAIRVCRSGLALHPDYLSARLTLGRSLMELGRLDESQAELESVLRAAPENLAAARGLADISRRRDAPSPVPAPSGLPPASSEFDSMFRSSDQQFAQALVSLDALSLELGPPPMSTPAPDVEATRTETPQVAPNTALVELESWLAAIVADRESRA